MIMMNVIYNYFSLLLSIINYYFHQFITFASKILNYQCVLLLWVLQLILEQYIYIKL